MNQEGCRIFVWGKLADIDVGDRKEVEVKVPTEISDQFDDNRIIQVASGSRHFVALTSIYILNFIMLCFVIILFQILVAYTLGDAIVLDKYFIIIVIY